MVDPKSIRTWEDFVAAWRKRVAGGQGSREALALYDAAKKTPGQAAFARCIERADKQDDAWGKAVCAVSGVEALFPNMDYGKTRAWLETGRQAVRDLLGEHSGPYAACLSNLGLLLTIEGNPRGARLLVERALAIREATLPSGHPDVATSLITVALALQAGNAPAAASGMLDRALAIQEAAFGPGHREVATTLVLVARAALARAELPAAGRLLDRALGIFEAADPRSYEVAACLRELGAVRHQQGDFRAARPLLERSVALHEKLLGRHHPEVAGALLTLATLLEAQNDLPTARRLIERALAINEAAFGARGAAVAPSHNNLANVILAQGDLPGARWHLERAIEINEAVLGPRHPTVAQNLSNLAFVLAKQGDPERARRLYERALGILEAALGPRHPLVAQLLNNLGLLLGGHGDLRAAHTLHTRALEIREAVLGPSSPAVEESLINLGWLRLMTGETDAARAFLARALAIRSARLDAILGTTSEREKVAAVRARQDPALMLEVARRQGAGGAALALQVVLEWKGRAFEVLAAQRAALGRAPGPDAQERFSALRKAREELASLALREVELHRPAERERALEAARLRVEGFERELAVLSSRFAAERHVRRPGSAEVCARLPRSSALVELVVFPRWTRYYYQQSSSHLMALVLRAGSCAPRLVDIGPAGPVERAVLGWRAMLAAQTRSVDATAEAEQALRKRAAAVAALVWRPLEPVLRGVERLYVAPDGPLHAFPFGALPGRKHPYLVEERTIATLTSGRDLLRPGAEGGEGALVLGRPDYDVGASVASASDSALRSATGDCLDLARTRWPGLPDTAEEAALVAERTPGTITLSGAVASRGSFLELAPGRRVLHLATHGYFVSSACHRGDKGLRNPLLFAGLALAGANTQGDQGYLTALDVSGMDLSAAELVVLSACETGLGEVQSGEGVFGLQRAFLLAGAQNLVLSLFKVPSAETVSLMSRFYAERARGADAAAALRQAQLAQLAMLRKAGRSTHPLYWAGFVAVGR